MWNDIDTGAYEGMIAETVSIPKENSAHSYNVITDDEIIFKDLDGNAYKKVSYDEL